MSGVIAVTATMGRPVELERLLASLAAGSVVPRAIIVVDNAGDPATRAVADRSPLPADYLAPGANLGCGGGLHAGETRALERFGAEMTHLWILDDDAVVAPDALARLLAAADAERADAAYPMVVDGEGCVGWYPGVLPRAPFRALIEPAPPEKWLARFGSAPLPFSWAPGVALLVSRRALEALGPHRTDFWVRGEDLEFSLRLTHRFRGIFVPDARVQHLPPASASTGEYAKHAAMLRNVAYTALRLPHGRRIAATIPGNWLRFWRTWGWTPRALADGFRALWDGAVRARPAGAK